MTRNQFRFASFEALEPRLVMSAQALTDFVGALAPTLGADQIDQQIEVITQSTASDVAASDVENIRNQFGLDGSGQTIAVIDSGIAYDHEAFGGGFGAGNKVVGGYDFAENDANPYDDGPVGFHGSHVAGIIAADGEDFSGIAPGADLVSLRVFDDAGNGELVWVEQALQWVHENRNSFENPITTVNLSIGTDWNANTLPDLAQFEDEFAQLKADGIFVSVAAGNLFENFNEIGVSYPAASPFVVPVASHGADGGLSDFSQRNDRVLVAPGESVLSAVPEHVFGGSLDDPLLRASGTSQATPFVAGASALLREAFQEAGVDNIDQDLLYEHFRETADIVFDQATGGNYHRINVERAIETALQQTGPGEEATQNDPAASGPFYVQDGTLFVRGSGGNDQITFRQGQVLEVVINNQNFSVDSTSISNVLVIGGGGTDSINAMLSGEVDRAVLQQNRLDVFAPAIEFTARGFESISLDGGQNADRLVVRDTGGNDQFVASYQQISFNGNGFEHQATGFSTLQVVASEGNDSIQLEGSAGNDRFVYEDGRGVLRNDANRIVARGFDQVSVIATAGSDIARLHDTAGSDRFELTADSFHVTGGNVEILGHGFSRITANSDRGFDTVVFTGTDGADQLLHRDSTTRLQGDGYTNIANGFEQAVVFGGEGTDTARIFDSAGNDQFSANGFNTSLQSNNNVLYTNNFDIVDVYADLAGTDSATLTGTQFSDSVSATVDSTRLQNAHGFDVTVHGFDSVLVDTGGGFDSSAIVGGEGIDLLRSFDDRIEYESLRQMLQIVEAESHVFDGQEGFDEVIFSDFESLDLLSALGDSATAFRSDQTISAIDIEFLEASTQAGATGIYEIDAVDFLYLLDGDWEQQA